MRYYRALFFCCVVISIPLCGAAFYSTEQVADKTEDDLFSSPQTQTYEEALGLKTEGDALSGPVLSIDTQAERFSKEILISKQQERVNEQRKVREHDEQAKNTELKNRFEQECEKAQEKVRNKDEKGLFQKKSKIAQGIFLMLCLSIIGFVMYREGAFKDILNRR
jgi:hypothetical protein